MFDISSHQYPSYLSHKATAKTKQQNRMLEYILYKIKMLCSYQMEFVSLLPIITLNLSWQVVTCSRNRAEQLALGTHQCSFNGPSIPRLQSSTEQRENRSRPSCPTYHSTPHLSPNTIWRFQGFLYQFHYHFQVCMLHNN